MDRAKVLAVLREHRGDLHRIGVVQVRLFGSTARGERTATSDVDVAVVFEPAARPGLVTLGRLHADLSDWLATDVDLTMLSSLKDKVRGRVNREGIDAL